MHVRECFAPRITEVNSAHVSVGGALTWAKTAACAVCFDVDSVSFLFIATSLASGRQVVEQRNQACATIDQALLRLLCPATTVGATPRPTPREKRVGGQSLGRISNATALFDRVFWMGGFNYEIDANSLDVERCGHHSSLCMFILQKHHGANHSYVALLLWRVRERTQPSHSVREGVYIYIYVYIYI